MNNALVPIVSGDNKALGDESASRPRADFLAQLIATLAQAPQTRARRRAEPDEAIAAYGAGDRPAMPAGHTLSRSL